MLCEQARQILADYLGDELGEADRLVFERHLAECADCAGEVASLQAAIRSMGSLRAAPATPVMAVRQRVQRRMALWQPLAYAATLLLGVSVGWFARPSVVGNVMDPTDGRPVVAPSRPWTEQDLADDSFVRNALALSSAFTQGTRSMD